MEILIAFCFGMLVGMAIMLGTFSAFVITVILPLSFGPTGF